MLYSVWLAHTSLLTGSLVNMSARWGERKLEELLAEVDLKTHTILFGQAGRYFELSVVCHFGQMSRSGIQTLSKKVTQQICDRFIYIVLFIKIYIPLDCFKTSK